MFQIMSGSVPPHSTSVVHYRARAEKEASLLASSCQVITLLLVPIHLTFLLALLLQQVWEAKYYSQAEGSSLGPEVEGLVRCAVGQGRLLLGERLHQFLGLVKRCEDGQVGGGLVHMNCRSRHYACFTNVLSGRTEG